jgi:hypothetical protein
MKIKQNKMNIRSFLSNNNLHNGRLDLGVGRHAQVVVAAPDGDGAFSPAEIMQVIITFRLYFVHNTYV